MGFLRRILDTNKRVQEAARSAFATLEEIIYISHNAFPSLEFVYNATYFFSIFRKLQKN